MKKLKSLKDFQNENPDLEQVLSTDIKGGVAMDTFQSVAEDTLDSWNCPTDCCTRHYGDGSNGSGCYQD